MRSSSEIFTHNLYKNDNMNKRDPLPGKVWHEIRNIRGISYDISIS